MIATSADHEERRHVDRRLAENVDADVQPIGAGSKCAGVEPEAEPAASRGVLPATAT